MARFEQVNVRVPRDGRSAITRAAKRMREDVGFAGRLGRFLDEEEATQAALLSERIAKVEALLTRLAEGVPSRPRFRMLDDQEGDVEHHEAEVQPPTHAPVTPGANFPWTSGEGKGRRLTKEGEAELIRLGKEGVQATEIARRLGIRAYAVRSRLARDS